MPSGKKPRLAISACLLGRNVRYDGAHRRDDLLVGALGERVEWVPVCPELEAGMGVPREPVRLVAGPEGTRLVAERSGTDWTEAMRRVALARVGELEAMGVVGFVTKSASPSCGLSGVPVWAGAAAASMGVGEFVRVLRERLPRLPVEEEGRLHDPVSWACFLARVFSYRDLVLRGRV